LMPVLLIDEIRRSGRDSAVVEAVYRTATEHLAVRRVIFTSLDQTTLVDGPGKSAKSSSGTPITWLPASTAPAV